ncbi:hypothetical protein LSH36_13g14032 [Paralvinella palmiformis]|uniref:Uncharacterized protein n=1 Tax=Paralvinella palmiformis TaxID=53620 RepID=A0AAD9KCS9_9ANNE|nr:hypothetical protein LSH36_13g14032 [Paralvinella palmiformis]
MIPGSDLHATEAIRHSIAATSTENSLNLAGDYSKLLRNENIIRSEGTQLGNDPDTRGDENSSDGMSYQTATNNNDPGSGQEVGADWSTLAEMNQLEETIFAVDAILAEVKKADDNMMAALARIDSGLETSRSELSKMSSYATCLDNFDHLSLHPPPSSSSSLSSSSSSSCLAS